MPNGWLSRHLRVVSVVDTEHLLFHQLFVTLRINDQPKPTEMLNHGGSDAMPCGAMSCGAMPMVPSRIRGKDAVVQYSSMR